MAWMTKYKYPDREIWDEILRRPVMDSRDLDKKVRKVLLKVKKGGDRSLRQFTHKFDGVKIRKIEATEKEMIRAAKSLDENLKKAIEQAAENIRLFHKSQLHKGETIETMPGVYCWRKAIPVEKVGLYIPGGTAPLFSTVLMLGIPASIAGCREIVLCSPPGPDGKLHPAILYCARLAGITRIFKVGGAQAIGAMAYGTESIPSVYKIFGPGNQYVTCAKQMVQQEGIAIDMPAGPSEVAVYADESSVPAFVAADLLSQAEHGTDSHVLLVTTRDNIISEVEAQLTIQLKSLPRQDIARKSLENSKAILVKEEDVAGILNAYAPEHLILSCRNAEEMAEKILHAGSVFLGNYSPESVGDYASGTNHTLPTHGYARAYSGVSMDSFVKQVTFQRLTEDGLRNIAYTVETLAEAEGLHAHAEAVRIRVKSC